MRFARMFLDGWPIASAMGDANRPLIRVPRG